MPAFAQALAASIRRDIAPENAWVIAPRDKPPVFSGLDYSIGKMSETMPLFDLWPMRYATSYEFVPGPALPGAAAAAATRGFRACYRPVGDFPEVNARPQVDSPRGSSPPSGRGWRRSSRRGSGWLAAAGPDREATALTQAPPAISESEGAS